VQPTTNNYTLSLATQLLGMMPLGTIITVKNTIVFWARSMSLILSSLRHAYPKGE